MENITTKKAPQAIGPYSQAIKHNGLIFTSGQIPFTPKGDMVTADIESQTRQVFENLSAVLAAAGSSLESALKVTVYLNDMNDFSKMNEVYSEYLKHKPARSTVEVARLPKDVLVEIDVVACESADKSDE